MLARAQSLSGRPHDALVMLQRLAAMGVVTDAATNDDFSGVRALAGVGGARSQRVYKKTSGIPAAREVVPAPPVTAATPVMREPSEGRPSEAETPKVDAPKVESKPDQQGTRRPKAGALIRRQSAAPLIFSAPGLAAVGLGYDAVSGRFIVGDRKDRRLLVVGERSGRLASLAGVDAGFDEVSAFEIDAVEGDLWVVSSSSRSRSSTLHKLQLISGRVLTSIPLSTEDGPGRFTDVAVTPQSILVLDGEGRRIYRVAKKGRSLEIVARLAAPECSSLAPAADGVGVRRVRPRHPQGRADDSRDDRGRIRAADEPRGTPVDPLAPRVAHCDSGRQRWTVSAASHQARRSRPPREDRGRARRECVVGGPNLRHAVRRRRLLSQSGGTPGSDQVEVKKLPLK